MKKSLVFALLLMFVVTTTGGCGGGSGGAPIEIFDIGEPPMVDEPIEEYYDIGEPPEAPIPPVPDEDEETNLLDSDFWIANCSNPWKIMLQISEIEEVNQKSIEKGDLVNLYTIESIQESSFNTFGFTNVLVDNVSISAQELLLEFQKNKVTLPEWKFAVTVKQTNILAWPFEGATGVLKSALNNGLLTVNSPVIVTESCVFSGKRYYYGQGDFSSGWIAEENLAFCSSEEEWLDAWQINIGSKDFVVVTENGTKATIGNETVAELGIGTVLKLADPINYEDLAVILPTRAADGQYVPKLVYLNNIHFGFLSFTEGSIIEIMFNEARSNTSGDWFSIRQIFKCFGFNPPANSDHFGTYFQIENKR